MTKQTLGNRSFINQVKYSPKLHERRRSSARTTRNVWIGFNLGTGVGVAGELGERHGGQHRPA